MPLFLYRAVDDSGKTIRGRMYSRNMEDVKEKVNATGLLTVHIKEGGKFREGFTALSPRKAKIKNVSFLCRQLYIIIKSGVNLLNGLEVLQRETKNRVMRNILRNIINEVQRGRLISEAMNDAGDVLPALLINMVSVGEVSGNLDEILRRLSVYYEKEAYVHDKIRAAMVYPLVLVFMGILMVILFANFVLPEIVSIIQENNGQLPLATKIVIGAFDVLKEYYLLFIAVIIGGVLLSRATGMNNRFRLIRDKLVMKIPVVNTSIKNIVTSRFTRTMSIMLKGSIPLLRALESTEKVVNNAIVEKGIDDAMMRIKMGGRLGDSLAICGFFDLIVIHMIDIGEETGELDEMLDIMADYYDKESETWTLKLMSAAEPAFTIFIGVFIGFIIISLLLPIFNMLSQINL